MGLKLDVILTATDLAIAAAKRQTQTIPIVMGNSSRSGGDRVRCEPRTPWRKCHRQQHSLSGAEWEAVGAAEGNRPRALRVAYLWNPDIRGAALDYKETEGAAGPLGLQLQSVEVVRVEDLDRAFQAVTKGRAQALLFLDGSLSCEPWPDRELRAEESATVHVCEQRVRGRWRPHVLRAELSRYESPRCYLCGQDSERNEARRLPVEQPRNLSW